MSLEDLPDDILLYLSCYYLSIKDLCQLDQVSRRFYDLLRENNLPWKLALAKYTNVSYSTLKNAAGCPSIQNFHQDSTIPSEPFYLPDNYTHQTLIDNTSEFPRLIPEDQRQLSRDFERCKKSDCDINRCISNDRYLLSLSHSWNSSESPPTYKLVKFVQRAQTSLIQYDEHKHQLWFTFDYNLNCINLRRNQIDHKYEFNDDDILCYKVYNDNLICLANGNVLKIICRQTNDIYPCDTHQNQRNFPSERHDILSLDIYSNDNERYLILNGARDHTISMRAFDISPRTNKLVWQAKVDDRVLSTRFTNDGNYFLIGTGGTQSHFPLLLFNSERSQPIHIYAANYRRGAGVRCIEWASPNVFIAAGFDNQFKEFDLRTGQCHYTFNDSYGNDYCSLAVSVNYNDTSNAIILGGNHHSTVRVVNRKQRELEKVYFASKEASPIHSLAVTPEYLFASVDRSIVALDFTRCYRRFSNINLKL